MAIGIFSLFLFLTVLPSGLHAQAPAGSVHWKLVPELRIGQLEGGASALTEVSSIALHGSGLIFVAQPLDHAIKVFDRSGNHVRTIGREGFGPGEFSTISEIDFRGDTLWVSDTRQSRFTEFSLDGELVGTFTFRGVTLPGVGRPVVPRAALSSDRYIATALQNYGDFMSGGTTIERVLETDSLGVPVGQFGSADIAGAAVRIIAAGRSLSLIRPLRTAPHAAWSADGAFIVYVDQELPESAGTAEYVVTLFRSANDTIYSSNIRQRATPVGGMAGDSILNETARSLSEIGITEGSPVLEVVRDSLKIPAFWPMVNQIAVDTDGSVFLARYSESGTYSEWTVLRPDGELAGIFRAPGGLQILAVDGTEIWGTITGELDVPYIYKYSLQVQ